MEAYEQGRSRGWYWKQVLAAIAVSFCQETVAHPVLALRAITIGWAIWFSFYYGVGPRLLGPFARRFFVPSGYPFSPLMLIWWTASLFVRAGSGWIVARLHRSHRTGMVLAFAVSVFFFDLRGLPGIWFEAANTLTNTRFLPYLVYGLEVQFLWPAAILVGGLWGADPARESVRKEQGSTA